MEEWQVQCIRRNFDKLIETTICNESLLSKLVRLQMLSMEEVDSLTHQSQTQRTQARLFYNIMEKRVNGFNALLAVFRATKQSGPLQILTTESQRWTNELFETITYDKNNVIGRGSPSTLVCKGKFGSMDVAVKLTCHIVLDSSIKKLIVNERKVLRECGAHPNIVSYYGSEITVDYIVIALELCDTALSEWITNRSVRLSPLEVLKQTTVGLEWLHSKNIIHRDLKPENILLKTATPNPLVKISNFGISKCVLAGRNYISTMGTGTLAWMPPEVLAQVRNGENCPIQFVSKFKKTFEADIFSLGCVYYYVLTNGKYAFGDFITSPTNILSGHTFIVPNDVVNAVPENLPIVEQMMVANPILRPSCSYLLSCTEFWENRLGEWSRPSIESEAKTLICRMTNHEITMGYMRSDGRPELIPNFDGDLRVKTCMAQTSENVLVFGKDAIENIESMGNFGVAESKLGITFSSIILAVTLPLILEHEEDIRVGATDIAGFNKVQVVTEMRCLAIAYQIETNGHSSNNTELLVLSHSCRDKFSILTLRLNIDFGLYKCGQNASVTKIYEHRAVIRTKKDIFLELLNTPSGIILEPDILPQCLINLLRSRRLEFAVVTCEETKRRDFILRELQGFSIDVHPLQNYELAVIKGAALLGTGNSLMLEI